MTAPKKVYSKRLVEDPDDLIALAAENAALSQRNAEAWGIVADLARVLALQAGAHPGDTAFLELVAGDLETRARAAFTQLMTTPCYSALPPLAEVDPHLHQVLVGLLGTV